MCRCLNYVEDRLTLFADVAQLAEQRYRKPRVVGSIPTIGSSNKFMLEFIRGTEKI